MGMHDYIEQFLAYMSDERRMSANTIAAYRTDLDQLEAFLVDNDLSDAAAINHNHMLQFVLYLRQRRYANSTIARRTAAVKSFFAFLKERQIIADDPTDSLDTPRVDRTPPRAISPHQVDELLELPLRSSSPEGLRDKAMLELLYATGMRVSELVALNLDDIDIEQQQIRCAGKGGRERFLPCNASSGTALEEYLEIGRTQLARSGNQTADALFLNHRGKRLTRQGFWLILKGYAEEIGLHDLTPHMLRHSCAAHMLGNGAELREVQERLGHASLSTTQIYTHLPDQPASTASVPETLQSNGRHRAPVDDLLVEADPE
jgi:integrase/recombinase XerD